MITFQITIMRLVTDLIRIAAAGGGLRIDASKKCITDIIRIASAAKTSSTVVIIEKTDNLLTSDMIRIANAGEGCVIFNDLL